MRRIAELFRARRLDRELDDEVGFHLAQLEAEFRAKGMSEAAAAVAARREFGGVAQAKEAYRDARGMPRVESLIQDVRYALRVLRLNPGFTAAAVLSLALGIGASTAIFSMFHTLMLQMLPVSHPEELLSMYRTGGWGSGISSYPLYLELQKRGDLFNGVLAHTAANKIQIGWGGERREMAQRELVSGNYFQVLGVRPEIGRLLTDNDNRTPMGHPVAVLSYEFWRNRLGADPNVVGRTLLAGKTALTVVGVASRDFRGISVDRRPDFWEPLMMSGPAEQIMEPGANWLWILARKRPDVSRSRVQAAVNVLYAQYLWAVYGSNPVAGFRTTALNQHIEVRDGGLGLSLLRDQFAKPLTILMAAVLMLLLAACVNVANLLLARGAARRKEVALRLSLGATRGRLIRQALTESFLLAAAGGALGILLAVWGESAVLRFLPANAGNPFVSSLDGTALAFCLTISMLSVVVCGLAPALRSTTVDPAAGLHAPNGGSDAGRPRFRSALVVLQVAFSVVLAVMAGLFGHSLGKLRSLNLGFRNQDVVAVTIHPPGDGKPEEIAAARDRFLSQLRSIPGVTSASFGMPGPYRQGTSSGTVFVPGSSTAGDQPWVDLQIVGPDYFATLGTTLVAGREFSPRDDPDSNPSAIVNEAFVRKFFPGRNPLDGVVGRKSDGPWAHIIGIVPDIAHGGVREKPAPTLYLPVTKNNVSWGTALVRSWMPRDAVIQAVRREVERLGPQVNASEPRSIRQDIDDSIFQDRMLASLSGCFGGLTLLLAAIGLYGVVSYGTAQRSGEIGIRIALGAQRGRVLWMVLRSGLLLVAGGLGVGLPVSIAAARYVSAVLFGVKADDPLAFVSTAAVLVAIGMAAAFWPARRSASMDPMRALRHE